MKTKQKDKSKFKGFSDEERAAMKERAQELIKEGRGKRVAKKDGEGDLLAKIAEMQGLDRKLAERIHAIVKEIAPALTPKTWYGMPAYANEQGKVICFFTSAQKFGSRYATFGFNDDAKLDDGPMWPASYAVKELTPLVEAKIADLVKKAVG